MAGKTEWEDMLIRLGKMEAPPPEEKVDLWKLETTPDTRKERLENADLDELDELEDDEDEKVLEEYRKKRMAELQAAAVRNKYGAVINISKPDWQKEVTNAPPDVYVVVNLYKQGVPQSLLLDSLLSRLAVKHKDVKFVRIRADDAIENYPDRHCPTLFIYKGGDIAAQLITLAPLAGDNTTAEDIEWRLGKMGILKTDLTEDPKLKRENKKNEKGNNFASYLGKPERPRNDSDEDDESDDD